MIINYYQWKLMIVNDNQLVRYFRGTSKASAAVTLILLTWRLWMIRCNAREAAEEGGQGTQNRGSATPTHKAHHHHHHHHHHLHHHHHHYHQAFFTTDLQLCTLECAKVPAKNLASLLGHLDLSAPNQNHEYWLLRALSSPMQECN